MLYKHAMHSRDDVGTMYKNRGSLVRLPEAHSWMNLTVEYIGAYVFFS